MFTFTKAARASSSCKMTSLRRSLSPETEWALAARKQCRHVYRVALMAVSMGHGTELLYWEPLLRRFFNLFQDFRIMCLQPGLAERYPDLPFVPSAASLRIATPVRLGHYRWVTHIPSPSVILWAWRFRPDVIIVSEFSLLTVYGIVASWLRPRCGILLLVESDPGPTMASFSAGAGGFGG